MGNREVECAVDNGKLKNVLGRFRGVGNGQG